MMIEPVITITEVWCNQCPTVTLPRRKAVKATTTGRDPGTPGTGRAARSRPAPEKHDRGEGKSRKRQTSGKSVTHVRTPTLQEDPNRE